MKVKDYAREFDTKSWTSEMNNRFHAAFTTDFKTTVELAINLTKDGNLSLSAMKNLISQANDKFKSIRMRLPIIPEKYWNYFYATVASPLKSKVCAQDIKAKQDKYNKHKEFQDYMDGFFRQAYEDFFDRIVESLSNIPLPADAFTTLQMEVTQDVELIKKQYRILAKQTHSDKGGNDKEFILLTEAKNQCISWAKSK